MFVVRALLSIESITLASSSLCARMKVPWLVLSTLLVFILTPTDQQSTDWFSFLFFSFLEKRNISFQSPRLSCLVSEEREREQSPPLLWEYFHWNFECIPASWRNDNDNPCINIFSPRFLVLFGSSVKLTWLRSLVDVRVTSAIENDTIWIWLSAEWSGEEKGGE